MRGKRAERNSNGSLLAAFDKVYRLLHNIQRSQDAKQGLQS